MKQYQIIIKAIICLILSSVQLSAQSSEPRKIHLKDGSILVGYVIEDNDYHVKLVMETGDTLTVGYKNIVTESEIRVARKKTRVRPVHKYDGVFVTAGYQRFLMNDQPHTASFIAGKRINCQTNVGIELGYRWHQEFIGGAFIEPQYATAAIYARRYILDVGIPRIFIDGSVGYAVPTNSIDGFIVNFDYDGGILASLSGGAHIALRGPLSFVIKGGVTYSQTSGLIISEGGGNTFRTNYSKDYLVPFVNVGLEF